LLRRGISTVHHCRYGSVSRCAAKRYLQMKVYVFVKTCARPTNPTTTLTCLAFRVILAPRDINTARPRIFSPLACFTTCVSIDSYELIEKPSGNSRLSFKSIRDDASHTRARVATQLTVDEEPMIPSDRRVLPDANSTSL